MAFEVGTAANMEDFFTKILNFLTTSPALVEANQQWEVLEVYRDNLESLAINFTEVDSSVAGGKRPIHGMRRDNRTLGSDNPITASSIGAVQGGGVVAGTSHMTMKLRVAKEITSVRLRSPYSSAVSTMISNFRLQYSDDGATWTTALTVSSNPTYTMGEQKSFNVPVATGPHLYWRLRIDSLQNGSTTATTAYWDSVLLMTASGEIANHFGSECVLKARGNAGADAIYTGLATEYDSAAGWYNLFINGYTGYDPNVTSWFEQPGALPSYRNQQGGYTLAVPMVPLWNDQMPYWFAASGRSFRFGVKVSTQYEGGYMGFILPYATPGQYPYPLAIGGSLVPTSGSRSDVWRYSFNSFRHSVFVCPGCGGDPNASAESVDTTLYLRLPDGTWGFVGQRYTRSGSDPNSIIASGYSGGTAPTFSGPRRGMWPLSTRHHGNTAGFARRDYREIMGGGYLTQPLIIHQRLPFAAVWGELEGVYQISGFSNAAENTAVVGGKNHIILQNVARTEVHEYWSLELS